jgi:hypothetical protein
VCAAHPQSAVLQSAWAYLFNYLRVFSTDVDILIDMNLVAVDDYRGGLRFGRRLHNVRGVASGHLSGPFDDLLPPGLLLDLRELDQELLGIVLLRPVQVLRNVVRLSLSRGL